MNIISTEKAPGAIGPYSQGYTVGGPAGGSRPSSWERMMCVACDHNSGMAVGPHRCRQ